MNRFLILFYPTEICKHHMYHVLDLEEDSITHCIDFSTAKKYIYDKGGRTYSFVVGSDVRGI